MATERDFYTVEVAGLTRRLPLFEVAPGVRIAVFNMLGDTTVVKAAAAVLSERIKQQAGDADVLVTAEAKSIPLIYELSALLGLPYVVLRKTYKPYMGNAITAETLSITTGVRQQLFLDEKDRASIEGRKVILVDDVVSTGSTLEGMKSVIALAGATALATAAVFTEGNDDGWKDVIALGNLPVFSNQP